MPQDNRLLIVIGAGLAVIAAIVLALVFSSGRDQDAGPPPAARGGLTIDVSDAPELNTSRELRCFVDGQYVGMATLSDCARRNGVATDALDVGLDETGALAAAPTAAFDPPPTLPPVELAEIEPPLPAEQPSQPSVQPASGSACLRHTGSEWRSLSAGMSLNACVQALYAGTCVRPGEAQYGRWGETTLRLVPRRVEQSSDNTRFRTLVEQDRGCQFPGLR
ncbi:MAG TPA: hypothetical protein VGB60_13035 [Brevundimonas sp.]|uniref:hypothetical protein n=1 Tax=Brevundimonas sp. TaxID=1871086 RepID=UPI002ED95B65